MLAGKEYGSGSSRDWAAKGTQLLGVRAVIARELRAHPPLQPGRHGRAAAAVPRRRDAQSLGLTGEEEFSIDGIAEPCDAGGDGARRSRVEPARRHDRSSTRRVRIDTPKEVEYFRHGGILQFVLRELLAA